MSGVSAGASARTWAERAKTAQEALEAHFWDETEGLFRPHFPDKPYDGPFHYWWQAHALDVLVDAYYRDPDPKFPRRIGALVAGVLKKNGNITNDYYDDMEWMALALLRAYDATGEEEYKRLCLELWGDIQTGWNDDCGGGIAWRKHQLYYKNTPANAPAVILAARLYQRFGDKRNLEWAKHIWNWLETHLLDPADGFVWDGMNREQNGQIDKGWPFTYNQGTVVGAALELWRMTKDPRYIEQAQRTAEAAFARLTDPQTGLLPEEGNGDGGLFKGILVRYLTLLALEGIPRVRETLLKNGETLWSKGQNPVRALFGPNWAKAPNGEVVLSTHLSGVMLLEALARLDHDSAAHLS